MLEGIVFSVVTLALAFVSRASLLKPGSHGFYRFFAWEFMLTMFVMDLGAWFDDVHSLHQLIAGWLFFTSLVLVLSGVLMLQVSGKPDANRNDVPMFPFEKTTTLVTHGIYRYIRHPIYASLFFLCWGFFSKHPSLLGALCGLAATTLLLATARVEEDENIRYFGDQYREYMKRSKMFVPFIL